MRLVYPTENRKNKKFAGLCRGNRVFERIAIKSWPDAKKQYSRQIN